MTPIQKGDCIAVVGIVIIIVYMLSPLSPIIKKKLTNTAPEGAVIVSVQGQPWACVEVVE